MRRLSIAMLLAAAIYEGAPTAYGQAAAKKIAERIGTFVDPTATLDARGFVVAPPDRPAPEFILRPVVVQPKPEGTVPQPPSPERKSFEPRPAAEAPPLLMQTGQPTPPVTFVLPTQPLLKQYVLDPRKALDLPALGVYVADRVSVAEPSMEISAQLILKPQQPERVNPAPFMPWNIPDPFELAETIRLRTPWPESPEPPLFVMPPTRR